MSDRLLGVGATPGGAAVSSRVATQAVGTTFSIILSLSFCHLLNDMMQSLVPALYPILKRSYGLTFSQIGLITLAFQCTASLLQPLVGMYTDRRPQPYSLTAGISLTLIGLLLMSRASTYLAILLAAVLIGMGSSIFHPEASRVARMAAGGRYGLAQSLFQVGGNIGSASGPLLAAFVVVPRGQSSIAWFSGAALIAIFVLLWIGRWYAGHRAAVRPSPRARVTAAVSATAPRPHTLSRRKVIQAVAILVALLFSKNVYSASLGSYYTFYLIDKFHLSIQTAQFYLFAFLVGIVAGTAVVRSATVSGYPRHVSRSWCTALCLSCLATCSGLAFSPSIAMIMASLFSAIRLCANLRRDGWPGGGISMASRSPRWSSAPPPSQARRPHQLTTVDRGPVLLLLGSLPRSASSLDTSL